MNKWLVVGVVAALVMLFAHRADAADPANVSDLRNWDYLPGFKPGVGVVL